MNTTRMIWGIVCLAMAAVLAVLNITLPANSIQFTLGETNMPWVPPVVLAGVGTVLLVSAAEKGTQPGPAKAEETKPPALPIDAEKAALNKRFESIAWGCFLIMLGGFALVPDETIPKGVWSIGVGVIMLGLNALRYVNRIRMSGFTTFLGILSVLGGIAEMLGWTSLNGALLLILLGAYLILKPWFEQKQLFGKAEHSRIN
jgi:hypothetical protein